MIIFDASTLILLAKIDILKKTLSRYKGVMTECVKEEINYKNDFVSKQINEQIINGKILVFKNPEQQKINQILKDFPIGKGEATALILAKEDKAVIATDDGLAIKVSKILEVKFVTAIHFLIWLNLDKSVSLAKLELLQEYGRYSIKIINDAKEKIIRGE
jgi:predicted nucleic acid-binding protein